MKKEKDIYKQIHKYKSKSGVVDLNKVTEKGNGIVDEAIYGTNAKCWYKVGDCRVLFKVYDNDIEPFGEVLYSRLAETYNINSAKYDFAFCGSGDKLEKGTISYDLNDLPQYNHKAIIIDGLTFFSRYESDKLSPLITRRTNNLDLVKLFNKKYNNYASFSKLFHRRYPNDAERLEVELIKMAILAILLDNEDINLWNIMIITDEYGNNPHVYSIDSSFIAGLNRGEDYIKSALESVENGDEDISNYLSGGIYQYDVDVKDTPDYKPYNPCEDLLDFYRKSDKEDREHILNLINEIEIKPTIDELVSKGNVIDQSVIKWIELVFNYRKSYLKEKMSCINICDTKTQGNRNLRFKTNKKWSRD